MVSKVFFVFLFLCTQLFAIDFQPWLPPLWEFQSEGSVWYEHQNELNTSHGDVSNPGSILSIHGDLGMTFWPNWEIELAAYFTRTPEISFTYETVLGQVKYQWFDDVTGDPFALATGLLVFLPNTQFLHTKRFFYHGEFNAELYGTIGKEWNYGADWFLHLWTMGAFGFSNHGAPWIHALLRSDFKITTCTIIDLFAEGVFGLGRHSLDPTSPFRGYANINHQTIDIGAKLEQIHCYGTLSIKGWYNLFARNFFRHFWGLEFSLYVPFGI